MCPFFQFVSGWSLFLNFRLESLCFRSQVSVPNYLSFPFSWFQISLSFPFRHFPWLVLRFFLDRIQNLCFPSRHTWYGVQQFRRISPTFITWLKFCRFFHFCWGSPVKSGAKRPKLKISDTGVLGTGKQIGLVLFEFSVMDMTIIDMLTIPELSQTRNHRLSYFGLFIVTFLLCFFCAFLVFMLR